jgi:hypothetical protein
MLGSSSIAVGSTVVSGVAEQAVWVKHDWPNGHSLLLPEGQGRSQDEA